MDDTAIKLYTALNRVGRQMHRISHSRAGHYREQMRILKLIEQNNGVIQRDLAWQMDVRASSMTEMLAKLEKRGLVERKQDDDDQRVMHIFLTDQGIKAAQESEQTGEILINSMFKGLTEPEMKQMLILTEKLIESLSAREECSMANSCK
ncbi:MAG: MarR family transcriptional regulator [Bacillota bacterium]|nr:MarR family transcriptional regulator [Bacillota bacterium]